MQNIYFKIGLLVFLMLYAAPSLLALTDLEVYSSLEQFIQKNKTKKFKATFDAGHFKADFSKVKNFKLPLIFDAASSGNLEIVKFLISKGSDVNQISDYGTIMHFALEKGHIDVASVLLNNGFDPRIEHDFKDKRNPFNIVAYRAEDKDRKFYKAMIKQGMELNLLSSRSGMSIVHIATQFEDIEMLYLLERNHADMNKKMHLETSPFKIPVYVKQEYTPLMLAKFYDKKRSLNVLLGFKSVDQNLRSKEGKTAFEIDNYKTLKEKEKRLCEAQEKKAPEFVAKEIENHTVYKNKIFPINDDHNTTHANAFFSSPKVFNTYSMDMDVQGENIVIVGGSGLSVSVSENGGKRYIKNKLSRYAESINKVTYLSDGSIYMIPRKRYIYRSRDHGKSFEEYDTQKLLKDHYLVLTQIKFFNEKIGFVLSEDGILLRTEDGGDNWKAIALKSDTTLRDIDFVEDDFFVLAASNMELFFSYDGGKTWTDRRQIKSETKQYTDLKVVDFVNKKVGYTAGKGAIYKTIDGGKSFSKIDFVHTYAYGRKEKLSDDGNVTGLAFIDENIGFIVTDGDYALYRTLDGGKTFNAQFDNTLTYNITVRSLKIRDHKIYILGKSILIGMDIDVDKHQDVLQKNSRLLVGEMQLLDENISKNARVLKIKVPMQYLDEKLNLVELDNPPKSMIEKYRYQYFVCEDACHKYKKQKYFNVTGINKNVFTIKIAKEDEKKHVRIFRVNKDSNKTEFSEFELKRRVAVKKIYGNTAHYTNGIKKYSIQLNEKYRYLCNEEYKDVVIVVKRFSTDGLLLSNKNKKIDKNGMFSINLKDLDRLGWIDIEAYTSYSREAVVKKHVPLKAFEKYDDIENINIKLLKYGLTQVDAEVNVEDKVKVEGRLFLMDKNNKVLAKIVADAKVKDKKVVMIFEYEKLLDDNFETIFENISSYSVQVESYPPKK